MKRLPHFKNSINSRLVLWLVCLLTPLLFLLIFDNVYAIRVVRSQVTQSNMGTLDLYMNQMDSGFMDIERYMANMIWEIEDGYPVRQNDSDQVRLKRQFVLHNELTRAMTLYPDAEAVFIYIPKDDSYLESTQSTYDVNERLLIRDFLKEMAVNEADDFRKEATSWYYRRIGSNYYLFRTFKVGDYFAGTFFNMDELISAVNKTEFGKDKLLSFYAKDGTLLTMNANLEQMKDREVTGNAQQQMLVGGDIYLEIKNDSIYKHFGMVAYIREKKIMEGLDELQRLIILISFGSLLLLPISLYIMEKILLKPLRRITKAMVSVKEGNLESRMGSLPDYREFNVVQETFDSMLAQIKQLKIDVYEEQILKQKSELQYLQLQINPHFFMNSLNIIYTMAEVESYDLIKDMAMCLVKHFRYILTTKNDYVTLEKEVAHTENYLYIQEMRYDNRFSYSIEIEPTLVKVPVPPLVIQTFAENTIKYGMSGGEQIFLNIEVLEDETGDFFNILIEDSGSGFSASMLQQLQSQERIIDERGEHFGIYNVCKRFKLLYGDLATIEFSNREAGGARIRMRLPKKQEE